MSRERNGRGAPPSRRLVRRRPAGARGTRAHQPAGGRRSSAVAIAALIFLFAPSIASACPVCFGNASGPMIDGMNNGIWVLLGILAVVQAGFIALFWSFWRRAKALRERREQFHLIQGGVH